MERKDGRTDGWQTHGWAAASLAARADPAQVAAGQAGSRPAGKYRTRGKFRRTRKREAMFLNSVKNID